MVSQWFMGIWVTTLVLLAGMWATSEMTAGEKRALDGYTKGL